MNARKRRVALLRNNFLPYSETFIHDEIRHHERYDVTVLARRHSNADRFPGHHVVAVEGPAERRPLRSALYGLTGFSPRLDRAVNPLVTPLKRRKSTCHLPACPSKRPKRP